jgi:galactose mutarotase-like enzyme
MRAVILENELLRITVLVDRGSDIVEFRYKPLDLDFLYFAPGGIRNPVRQTPPAASSSPYLDYFSGGWNEILPNGGPTVNFKGAELGQHGEISLIPWEYAIVADSPERVAVRLWVRPIRTPFFVYKTLTLESGRAVLYIEESVTNEGGERLPLMWGHHIAFGRPFLEEGAIIDAPARRFLVHDEIPGFRPRRFRPGLTSDWPLAMTPDGGTDDAGRIPAYGEVQAQEMAYLAELTDGWYAVTNQQRQVGFGIRFDPAVFRYVWYWQQLGDVAGGFPWWQRTHTAALEPWSSYPTNGLLEAMDNGTALWLDPGESRSARLAAVAYAGIDRVAGIDPDGTVRPAG